MGGKRLGGASRTIYNLGDRPRIPKAGEDFAQKWGIQLGVAIS